METSAKCLGKCNTTTILKSHFYNINIWVLIGSWDTEIHSALLGELCGITLRMMRRETWQWFSPSSLNLNLGIESFRIGYRALPLSGLMARAWRAPISLKEDSLTHVLLWGWMLDAVCCDVLSFGRALGPWMDGWWLCFFFLQWKLVTGESGEISESCSQFRRFSFWNWRTAGLLLPRVEQLRLVPDETWFRSTVPKPVQRGASAFFWGLPCTPYQGPPR